MRFLFSLRRGGSRALGLVALAGTWSCSSPDPAPATESEHLTLGNPSGATADVQMSSNYLLIKPQFALSYHRNQGKPNWVSWHLTTRWLGSAARQDNFRPDTQLPTTWYRVTSASYSGSGFDRGHNCPSADRTSTTADNSATFLMTNMMPQAPRNNQRTWAGLEEFCRRQLQNGTHELYVVCGSYGRGGTGSEGYKTTLDQGRVTVPAHVWKVVVMLPTGDDDAARVTANTRVIAVAMPNDNNLTASWEEYRTSVDAIEAATGYDLLSAVAPAVQQQLERRIDQGPI
ncbi:endonuclease G [Hymenobacter luteus]|uniref:Endonuclease G n=2 Tax=Hymenobacter TaxID=89966 RepID=A0A7W9WCL7_9BACT|nr:MULTISPECIES: DNA/RNA non-specific endonuclease [Hymenobacter]MBB4601926.1 endonuclease G [Hymenobacter latericoloratus]MBB6059645.1 endonuclease G [Hymenobacter luteus]